MAYETILVDTEDHVTLITLNRPRGAECAECAAIGRARPSLGRSRC